jgi:hypothetical protein
MGSRDEAVGARGVPSANNPENALISAPQVERQKLAPSMQTHRFAGPVNAFSMEMENLKEALRL